MIQFREKAGRTDRQTDGQTDGRTDGQTDDTEFIRPHYRGSKNNMETQYNRKLVPKTIQQLCNFGENYTCFISVKSNSIYILYVVMETVMFSRVMFSAKTLSTSCINKN